MMVPLLALALAALAQSPPSVPPDTGLEAAPSTEQREPPKPVRRLVPRRDAVISRPEPKTKPRDASARARDTAAPAPTEPADGGTASDAEEPAEIGAAAVRLFADPWRLARPSSQLSGRVSLAFATLLLFGASLALHLLRRRLRPGATVTRAADAAGFTLRMAALMVALALLASVLPGPLALLPLLLLGGAAVGLGFASTATLKDVVAGVMLRTEGRAPPGTWIRLRDGAGEGRVRAVGLRATTLDSAEGHQLNISNRALLDGFATRPGRWLRASTTHTLPNHLAPTDARRRLRELGMLSPWRASGTFPTVEHGTDGAWTVTVPIIAPRFLSSHREFMHELAPRCAGSDEALP